MHERIQHLFQLCLAGKCTEEDRQELAGLLTSLSEDEATNLLQSQFEQAGELNDMDSETANSILRSVVEIKEKKRAPVFSIKKLAAAAAILIVLATSYFYLFQDTKSPDTALLANVENELTNSATSPKNKSTLTLSDGSLIILDSAATGSLGEESGIKIVKKADGSLEYITTGTSKEITYNTLYNPPGGRPLRLTLEDGSLVLLNSASSVVFPTAFVGKERRIEMNGEIYLQVAKNKALPFYVVTDKLEVQVLGTQFNVKNYPDDINLEVTLEEGKVAVNTLTKRYELSPDKQLRFRKSTAAVNILPVNVSDFISWKDGVYTFNGNTLSEIVKVLRRWYDVSINIEDIANAELIYTAIVYKNESLDKFMKRLEESSNLNCVRIGNTYYIR